MVRVVLVVFWEENRGNYLASVFRSWHVLVRGGRMGWSVSSFVVLPWLLGIYKSPLHMSTGNICICIHMDSLYGSAVYFPVPDNFTFQKEE